MALRAVVFDYGMVLSGPPDPAARQQMLRIAGLTEAELERHYWTYRHAYDRGELTGLEFWHKLSADAELALSAAEIAELNAWDARMWTTVNPEMLELHRRWKAQGVKTAILSNMGDSVLESILERFAWIEEFDVLVWSYQHLLAKPELEIYQLVLHRLGTAPEETLFLDDKPENIEAARRLGIVGIQFSTPERLRLDMASAGLEKWLPEA